MNDLLPSDLSDSSLRQAMPGVVAAEHRSIAALVACLAEYGRRRLHNADGYPTLCAYAIDALGYSEDSAWRRAKAAEVAQDFPAVLPMLADGRLHLTALVMVAPHLTRANADELLELVALKNKKTIERVLAERFPHPDLPTRLAPLASQTLYSVAPARNDGVVTAEAPTDARPTLCTAAPARNEGPIPPAKLAMRAPERFGLQVTIDETTHDLLRRAQELLSHQVPNGDLPTVLRRVLEAAVPVLEKRKFGTAKARVHRSRAKGRNIPKHVKHAVWKRDGGQCTYVGGNGHRCTSRKFLEFHHIVPFARDGDPTIPNIQLRCRAHNQYEAMRDFGFAFMEHKRAREALD